MKKNLGAILIISVLLFASSGIAQSEDVEITIDSAELSGDTITIDYNVNVGLPGQNNNVIVSHVEADTNRETTFMNFDVLEGERDGTIQFGDSEAEEGSTVYLKALYCEENYFQSDCNTLDFESTELTEEDSDEEKDIDLNLDVSKDEAGRGEDITVSANHDDADIVFIDSEGNERDQEQGSMTMSFVLSGVKTFKAEYQGVSDTETVTVINDEDCTYGIYHDDVSIRFGDYDAYDRAEATVETRSGHFYAVFPHGRNADKSATQPMYGDETVSNSWSVTTGTYTVSVYEADDNGQINHDCPVTSESFTVGTEEDPGDDEEERGGNGGDDGSDGDNGASDFPDFEGEQPEFYYEPESIEMGETAALNMELNGLESLIDSHINGTFYLEVNGEIARESDSPDDRIENSEPVTEGFENDENPTEWETNAIIWYVGSNTLDILEEDGEVELTHRFVPDDEDLAEEVFDGDIEANLTIEHTEYDDTEEPGDGVEEPGDQLEVVEMSLEEAVENYESILREYDQNDNGEIEVFELREAWGDFREDAMSLEEASAVHTAWKSEEKYSDYISEIQVSSLDTDSAQYGIEETFTLDIQVTEDIWEKGVTLEVEGPEETEIDLNEDHESENGDVDIERSFSFEEPGDYRFEIMPKDGGLLQSALSSLTGKEAIASHEITIRQTDMPRWEAYCSEEFDGENIETKIDCLENDIVPEYFNQDSPVSSEKDTEIAESLCDDLLGYRYDREETRCTP